jgi:caffeoyl-CoA O-methyltransferase
LFEAIGADGFVPECRAPPVRSTPFDPALEELPVPDPSRTIGLSAELAAYVADHANPPTDAVATRLAATTVERFGAAARMNIEHDQGRLLALFVELLGAELVVEVGTFTGMSALWLARALPPSGRLICFDITDRYLPTAREAWTAAGVDERIEVRIGPAAERLAELPIDPMVDLAFIDADKTGYVTYLDLLLPRLRPGGMIVVDNTLWSGAVVDPSVSDADTVAIRAFNDAVAARSDIVAFMLPVGDGITIIRPR